MTTSFRRTPAARLLTITLCIGALAIAGCNKTDTAPAVQAPAPPAAVAPTPAAAPAPAAYTPPSAEQLYQLVAPIALYPDKLVAQVLAGATYPDQITAAHGWLAQNAALRGGPLADAANQQPWDPSVKSLTAFRPVLDQMAGNIAWTGALGQAYYNDPADVMNAIQVMRQRASAAGRLKNNDKLRVASATAPPHYTPTPDVRPVYAGPALVEPPSQFITIEPAQPDVVYVPSYDPQRIYGEPVPVYPGYAYAPPVEVAPGYSRGQVAAAGAFTFGLGVVVGAALERHDWGWRSWDVNWGAPHSRDSDRERAVQPAYARPAVVYNNSTYISRSTTVVNNVRNVYNINNSAPGGRPAGAPAANFAGAGGLAQQRNAQLVQQEQQQREQQARQQQERQQAVQQAQQLQARQRQQERQEQQARLQQQQQQDRMQRQQAQRTQQAQQQAQRQAQQQERQARQQARIAPHQAPQALLQQQQQQDQARRQQAQQQQQQHQQARTASQQAQRQQQQQAMQERQQQRQSAQQEQARRQQMQQQQQAQQQARIVQQQQQMQRQQAQQQARQQQQQEQMQRQQQQVQAARQQQQQMAMQQQHQQRQQQQAQQQQQQMRQQQQAQQHAAAAAAAAHRRRPGEPPKDQP